MNLPSLPALVESADSAGAWPGYVNMQCSIVPTTRGLYYKFTAPQLGTIITVSNFNPNLLIGEVKFQISVLSGNCLGCLIFADFLDGEHSLTLNLNPGEEYVVLVSGESYDDVGTFDLSIKVSWF